MLKKYVFFLLAFSIVSVESAKQKTRQSASTTCTEIRSRDARRGEVPYHVGLLYLPSANNFSYACAGSLIEPDLVLTSAQCLDGRKKNDFFVIGGDHNMDEPEVLEQYGRIDQFEIHPEWKESGGKNGNIALVKLTRPFDYTNEVATIPLVGWYNKDQPDSKPIVSGRANFLQIWNPLTYDSKSCKEQFGEDKFCTSRRCNPKTCIGEPGGPLAMTNWAGSYLRGVVHDQSCESTTRSGSKVDVYTDVDFYNEWIHDRMFSGAEREDLVVHHFENDTTPLKVRFYSPHHPFVYDRNSFRNLKIQAPDGQKIRVTFEYMDLEKHENCTFDNVAIAEFGDNGTSTILFNGCEIPDPPYVTSKSNRVALQFQSDASGEGTGFSLFAESFKDEIPAPVIHFFTGYNFSGSSFNASVETNKCYNFPSSVSLNVSSIITRERCVILYTGSNCSGDLIRIYPGSSIKQVELPDGIDDNTLSYASCLYDHRMYIPHEGP